MSTDEMNSQERVRQERSRRSSIASLLHERARREDEPTFTPEYETEDPNVMDPTNLALALGEEGFDFYTQMVRIDTPQVESPARTSLGSMDAPRPATAAGGDATADALKSLM